MTEVVVNTCFKEEAINNYHQIQEEANPTSSEAALTIDQPETSTSPTDPSTSGNPWKEFDMLTAVVSRYHMPLEKGCLPPFNPMALSAAPSVAAPSPVGANPNDHRISCHRCGNIRKRKTVCSRANCPHTFCGRCTDKLKLEYGHEVFANGCPVCKDLCCCSNKSVNCTRKFHCYRKCPATKVTTPKNATTTVSTSSSPTASAMTMPSTMADCSNDETTSVEENSATSIIGQKQHRMNALLEACANFDETHKAGVEGEEEGRKNKKQKTSKSVAENSLAMLGVDPSVCAPTTVKVKKERKSTSSTASSSSSNAHNNSHAVAAANAMPMPSYPMPFYGFPHGAMAAAGPYGMIPLVPAHMLQGYNLPPQYGKMAGLEANDDAEMMYGKGVPPLIPVFPYYMPQYAAAMQAQSKSTNSKSSKAIPLPLPMHQASGINLLAAVSSHYLSDEEENLNSSITATPAEIPSN